MGPQRRILIVDDEQELTRTLGEFLLTRDYRVLEALTAEEAFEQLRRTPVDVVLLDLRLPKADGIEVLKAVRRHDPMLPVIVITAHAASYAEALATYHATRVLEKPLSIAALLEAIAAVEGRPVAAEPSPLGATIRVLVVDPVEATAMTLQQALDRRRGTGRTYVVEPATSRSQAQRVVNPPDVVLVNLEVAKEGHTVAMDQWVLMQAGWGAHRPKDLICYGAATSEAAKQLVQQVGGRALDLGQDDQQRIERLADVVESLATRRAA